MELRKTIFITSTKKEIIITRVDEENLNLYFNQTLTFEEMREIIKSEKKILEMFS